MNYRTLRLRSNLHWCISSGRAVFLDAQADRYFCLSAAANEAFLRLAARDMHPADQEILKGLIARGLLTDGSEQSLFQQPAEIEAPTHDLLQPPQPSATLLDVLMAYASEARATWLLRNRPFAKVIQAIGRPCGNPQPPPRKLDQRVRGIVAGSNAIAYLNRAHDRCLARALAVHSACRKITRTRLVFGVIGHPFAAHCWVQLGSGVLVGDFEQARLYTPILVVE